MQVDVRYPECVQPVCHNAEMNEPSASIGIFDSGFGGLRVLRAITDRMPEYDYIYVGDTRRAPYGDLSRQDVLSYTREGVAFLFSHGCGLVVLACNTSSSESLRIIQQVDVPAHYRDKRVLGVLVVAAEYAARLTRNKRVGVIATKRTVLSGAFPREIRKLDPSVRVFQRAAPALVPLIERGEHGSRAVHSELVSCLTPLIDERVDTLVLGCTHYGILEREIRSIIGENITLVAEESIVAEELQKYLARHADIEGALGKHRERVFYSTGETKPFRTLGSEFFGLPIEPRRVLLQADHLRA